MNKTGLFICLAIFIVCSPGVSGQGAIAYASNNFRGDRDLNPEDSLHYYEENGNAFTSNVYLNEISRSAYKHFAKNYPFASGEEWKKYKTGYLVIFTTSDSALYHVYYDRFGRFTGALTYYQKDRLPDLLTGSIPSIYKDYTVLNASGADDGIKTVFEISLVKDNSVKVVEISGREAKMVGQYLIVP